MSDKVHTVAQLREEVRKLIKTRVDAYTEELKQLRQRELAKSEADVCALCGNMETDADCACKLQKSAVTHLPPTVQGDLQAKLEYVESAAGKDPNLSVRDAQKELQERFGSKAYNKAVTDTLREIKSKARKRKKMKLAQSEMPASETKKEELDKCGETAVVAKEEVPAMAPAKKSRIPGAGRPLMKTPKEEVQKNVVPETMTGTPMMAAEEAAPKAGPKAGAVAKLNAVLHRKKAEPAEKSCGSYSKAEESESGSN